MQQGLKKIVSNIRFWLALFFVLRLFSITAPPLEVGHNWRQTTVTMVARNFLEADANVFYPRIDIAGEKTGITGMEFPALNYLIYLVSLVFGYAHWYGRLINLVISTAGLWYFYLLVKKYFSFTVAFNATFVLTLSVWYIYSRKIMPDTFSMSLVLAGFYYGSNYLDRQKSIKSLGLCIIFVLLGTLSKLPSVYLLVLFFPLIFNRETTLQRKLVFIAAHVFIVSAYYFYWVPYLTDRYAFSHFFMGKRFSEGFTDILQHLDEFFKKFYAEALGYSGFVVFVTGFIFAVKNWNKRVLWVLCIASPSFLVVVLKAGFAFYHHAYYIIPFAPVMALIAAYTFENIRHPKWSYVILTLFAIESIISKNHDFRIRKQNAAILRLEETLDKFGSRSDLVLINSGNVPTPMYFAHRKGWVEYNAALLDTNYINGLKNKGLKHIVVLRRVFGDDVNLKYKKLFENENYKIYNVQ